MKTILWVFVVVLALVGVLSIVLYVKNHKASVSIKDTSLLPREIRTSLTRESIASAYGGEEVAKFAPVTQIESDSLVLIEDQSLLGLNGGAFTPQFAPLSSAEQKTLATAEEQKPELQNMTAGDLNRNAGLGNVTWGGILLILLGIMILF